MAIETNINNSFFLEFLKRFIAKSIRPRLLVINNHLVHHPRILFDFVKRTNRQLNFFYLPKYSTALTPNNYLNFFRKNQKLDQQCSNNFNINVDIGYASPRPPLISLDFFNLPMLQSHQEFCR